MFTKVDNQEEPMRENLEQIEDSEAEETLSFCDLPIYDRATSTTENWCGDDGDQEFFEFFGDLRADVCPAANDVIFCGKLIPYKEKECHSEQDVNTILDDDDDDDDDDDGNQYRKIKCFFPRRRLETLKYELLRSRASAKDWLMRSKPSGKRSRKAKSSSARPWWPLLMFGLMVNVPKEMKLKDIRNRQNRRNPTSLFVTGGSGADKVSFSGEEEKGSWRLLRALSCRDHASSGTVVTPSLGCLPLL